MKITRRMENQECKVAIRVHAGLAWFTVGTASNGTTTLRVYNPMKGTTRIVKGEKAIVSGKTVRNGWYPEEKILEVTDKRDRTWSLRGQALTAFPWQAWPNVVGFNALMRWEDQEGRTGMGETQDFLGLETLTASA